LRSGRSTTIWRSQQRRVEDVRTVRGSDEDDVVLHLEAVHLDEQLVQRLLALVVTAAEAGAAVTTDGVDLVHEDDAGRVLLGLLEEITYARGAHADEHLDEVRARDREERHAGLAGDGTRQQRLAGARRAVEQHALGDARSKCLELLGVLEELLDLVELLHRLVDTRHVAEGDLRGVHRHPLRARLPEGHDLRSAALHLVDDEQPEQQEDHEGKDVREGREPTRAALRLHVDPDVLVPELVHQVLLGVVRISGLVLRAALQLHLDAVVLRRQRRALHLAVVDLLEELRVGRRGRFIAGADQLLCEEGQHDDDENGECGALEESAQAKNLPASETQA
jgi:hypothetical protein